MSTPIPESMTITFKKLHLPVRSNFAPPDDRLLTDAAYVEEVLAAGVLVLRMKEEAISRHVMDDQAMALLDKYEKQMVALKEDYERKESNLRRQCQEMEEEVTQKKADISQLQQEYQEIKLSTFEVGREAGRKELEVLLARERQELAERKEELKARNAEIATLRTNNQAEVERIRQDMNRIREEKDVQIQGLCNSFEGVQNLFKKGGRQHSCVELGRMGELFVRNWIESSFNVANVEYVSAEPHCADLLFEHDGIHILIETKNVATKLDKIKDIKKFHNDVELHSRKGFPQAAALFISLYDLPLIQGHRTTHFEVRHGLPVMYIGGVLECPLLIQTAILSLAKFAKNIRHITDSTNSSSEEDQYERAMEDHRTTAIHFMKMVRQMQEQLNRDRRTHNEMGVHLNDRERTLAEYIRVEGGLCRQFDGIAEDLKVSLEPVVGTAKILVSKEIVIDWLREHKDIHSVHEEDLCKEFGFKPGTIKTKLGVGIRELKKNALAGKGRVIDVSQEPDGREDPPTDVEGVIEV